MKHKLIYIEWEDACSSDAWMSEDGVSKWADLGRYIVKQVGFIYKETNELLILYGGYQEFEDYQLQYHQLIKIPKGWIRKRINLTKYIK